MPLVCSAEWGRVGQRHGLGKVWLYIQKIELMVPIGFCCCED